MKRQSIPFVHHALAAATLVALHGGVAAQSTAPGQLQTVTISAERRIENIREVPVSASVLQGEILEVLNTSGQDLRMLSGRVPSLNIESSFGRAFPRFYIRGYGNTDFRLNASQPVSLVYDDIVQENPILKGFPAFDLENIEVLRGPQGTLFGRNTPAGVVKFESVKPGKTRDGYASLSFGTYNTVNLEGAANIALGDALSARISLLNQTRDDWVDNTFAAGPTKELEGYRDSALRAQLLYAPSKDFSALFNLHARDFDGSARLFRANIIKPGTNELVDGFDEEKVSYDGQNEQKLQNLGGSARLRWALGDLAFHSITGYESIDTFSRADVDGGFGAVFTPQSGPGFIPFPVETADGIPDHSQFTQEFRVESNYAGPFNWQAGVFAFIEDYKIESFTYDSLAGGAQASYQRVKQTNDAYAIFGAVNYQATPDLKLRGGLRYTQDKKQFNVEAYQNGAAGLDSLGEISASPKDSKVNWDLSATYALDKATNLYARAATGFRGSSVQGAGAFNGQSVANAENNTSIEAGVKADLFDRRARVNFGVFSYTVKDLQLTAVGGGANSNRLINVEKAVGRGFELDLQALITDNLLASVGLGYNDTELKQPGLGVDACGNGCTIRDPILVPADPANFKFAPTVLIDGNPLPQAPKTTFSFTLKYTQPLANGELYAFTDWVYRSKVNFFLYDSAEYTGKALTEGGLRVGYTWGNGKYDAAAFVRNITNQIRVVGGIDFNNLTGFINEPRTFGLQFKASF
jgi:iron complex outermembrane receptor protein